MTLTSRLSYSSAYINSLHVRILHHFSTNLSLGCLLFMDVVEIFEKIKLQHWSRQRLTNQSFSIFGDFWLPEITFEPTEQCGLFRSFIIMSPDIYTVSFASQYLVYDIVFPKRRSNFALWCFSPICKTFALRVTSLDTFSKNLPILWIWQRYNLDFF